MMGNSSVIKHQNHFCKQNSKNDRNNKTMETNKMMKNKKNVFCDKTLKLQKQQKTTAMPKNNNPVQKCMYSDCMVVPECRYAMLGRTMDEITH